jgi:hypothetical protein
VPPRHTLSAMRLIVPALLLLAFAGAAGCAAGESGPSACEVGPNILDRSIAALVSHDASCKADTDCVLLNANIDCLGFYSDGCDVTAVHRDVAGKWSSTEVCREIDSASAPSGIGCDRECLTIEVKPACVSGVCTAVEAK